MTRKIAAVEPAACGRREEILEAATRLFAQHGYSDAITQLLADELDVGKGTLYRHFPSKRELFLAAADRVMRRLNEHLEASVEPFDDPLEKIAAAIRAYLEFFAANPDGVELLVQERAQFKDRPRPTYLEHRATCVERWRRLYRELIARGRFRDLPVERISDTLSAALYGAMFLNHIGGPSGAFSARAEDILDVVMYGLLSDEERSRVAAGALRATAGRSGSNGGSGPC